MKQSTHQMREPIVRLQVFPTEWLRVDTKTERERLYPTQYHQNEDKTTSTVSLWCNLPIAPVITNEHNNKPSKVV